MPSIHLEKSDKTEIITSLQQCRCENVLTVTVGIFQILTRSEILDLVIFTIFSNVMKQIPILNQSTMFFFSKHEYWIC